jgi:transposase-like protein
MVATETPAERTPRQRRPLAEKVRLVELTLRAGASVVGIAREHGVPSHSLRRWKSLHRAGKLDARAKSAPRIARTEPGASFVPVTVVPAMRNPRSAPRVDASAERSGIVELVLTSGARLRIEAGVLDTALVCALVAELQR